MDKAFYFDVLYPFQDEALKVLGGPRRHLGVQLPDGLPLRAALEGASSKAAGIFPADVARLLCTATRADWELVRWIEKPDPDQFVRDLAGLGEDLLLMN